MRASTRAKPSGPAQAVHLRRPRQQEIVMVVVLSPILALFLSLLTGAFEWVARTTHLGSAAAIVVFAVLPLALALAWRRKHLRSTDGIAIFERGFEVTERGRTRFVAWPELTEMKLDRVRLTKGGADLGVEHRHSVSLPSGDLSITQEYQGVDELMAALLHHASESVVPVVVERLDKGEKVSWFPLSLRRSGLVHGRERVSWSAIRVSFEPKIAMRDPRLGIREEYDELVIRDERGELARMRASQVPNAYLLPAVIAGMTARRKANVDHA